MSTGQQAQTGLGRLFAELKRRRVTRVIVLYASREPQTGAQNLKSIPV